MYVFVCVHCICVLIMSAFVCAYMCVHECLCVCGGWGGVGGLRVFVRTCVWVSEGVCVCLCMRACVCACVCVRVVCVHASQAPLMESPLLASKFHNKLVTYRQIV